MTATKELFFYAPTEEAADALARDLQLAGFMVPNEPRLVPADTDISEDTDGATDSYSLVAYATYTRTHSPDTDDELTTIYATCHDLAARHGATCDGSGEHVGDLAALVEHPGRTHADVFREFWQSLTTGERIKAVALVVGLLGAAAFVVVVVVRAFQP